MTKVAVILSGCGVFDGGEIHESTFTLLALDQAGVEYQCLAPNINQMHVINHLTGQEEDEQRNVLVESARIARGQVLDLVDAVPGDYDAVIVPGGFGVAKNLCSLACFTRWPTVNAYCRMGLSCCRRYYQSWSSWKTLRSSGSSPL